MTLSARSGFVLVSSRTNRTAKNSSESGVKEKKGCASWYIVRCYEEGVIFISRGFVVTVSPRFRIVVRVYITV